MHFIALLLTSLSLSASSAYTVSENVEYSRPGGVGINLDAHIPNGLGPFPAIILVHGGGWNAGTKTANFLRPLFPVLDSTGYAWFTIDYRLSPQHRFPAAADDVEAAITFVKNKAKQYKVNPGKIVLMGESAGGHLVDLVGARNKQGVAGVVSFYGPIDMVEFTKKRFANTPVTKNMKEFFQFDELNDDAWAKLRAASGSSYLSKKTPPFLLIQGTNDDAVPYELAASHMELFRHHQLKSDLIVVPGGVHGVINWEKEERFQEYKPKVIAWLKQLLGQ